MFSTSQAINSLSSFAARTFRCEEAQAAPKDRIKELNKNEM